MPDSAGAGKPTGLVSPGGGFLVERSVHLELEELVSLEATRSRAQPATFLGSPCQGHRSVRICLVQGEQLTPLQADA